LINYLILSIIININANYKEGCIMTIEEIYEAVKKETSIASYMIEKEK
jgi:hypothetical protein